MNRQDAARPVAAARQDRWLGLSPRSPGRGVEDSATATDGLEESTPPDKKLTVSSAGSAEKDSEMNSALPASPRLILFNLFNSRSRDCLRPPSLQLLAA